MEAIVFRVLAVLLNEVSRRTRFSSNVMTSKCRHRNNRDFAFGILLYVYYSMYYSMYKNVYYSMYTTLSILLYGQFVTNSAISYIYKQTNGRKIYNDFNRFSKTKIFALYTLCRANTCFCNFCSRYFHNHRTKK